MTQPQKDIEKYLVLNCTACLMEAIQTQQPPPVCLLYQQGRADMARLVSECKFLAGIAEIIRGIDSTCSMCGTEKPPCLSARNAQDMITCPIVQTWVRRIAEKWSAHVELLWEEHLSAWEKSLAA